MLRRAALMLALPLACFQEPTPSDDAGTATESGGGSTDTPHAETAAASEDSMSRGADASQTGSTGPGDDTLAAMTETSGEPPGTCEWALDWNPTLRKDLLILAHDEPANLGQLLASANALLGDGLHVAVASTCDEEATSCLEGRGYQHIEVDVAGTDPIGLMAEVLADVTLFREAVPDHLLVLTDVDTVYDEADVLRDPALAGAQIHARYEARGGACGETALEALALATGGSFECVAALASTVPDTFMQAQPGCELFGDVRDAPGSGATLQQLTLLGTEAGAPAELVLGGPGVCANEPDGWTIVDAALGHFALCPVACRDVGTWAPRELSATGSFDCR